MPHFADDSERNVVPRWRLLAPAARLEPLDHPSGRPAEPTAVSHTELEQLREDWERHRSPTYASDFVDGALIVGLPERAVEAARFLRTSGDADPIAFRQAGQVLSVVSSEGPLLVEPEHRHRRIAEYRARLRRVPNNPVLWADLAREYSSLGQNGPAERALRRALALAPENRFVLRAAVRFLLHVHEPQRAHDLIRRAPRLLSDPWLLAAELVAAEKADRTSRHAKRGLQMVDARSLHPRHTSELASALGTLEMRHGKAKDARRRFRQSLTAPTENSLAQAGWASRHLRDVHLPSGSAEVPRAFEAGAWDAYLVGRWEDSLDLAWQWLLDEPFATRPAEFGAWMASVVTEEFERALTFADAALQANPKDVGLLLHRVFALASLGRLDEAEAVFPVLEDALRGAPDKVMRDRVAVFERANRGLIAFRRGQMEAGRTLYADAVRLAEERHGFGELATMARLYQAREELRAGHPREALALAERAKRDVGHIESVVRHVYASKTDALVKAAATARVPPARASRTSEGAA